MHQGVGLPFLRAVKSLLEKLQGQCCLAQLLYDHVLIAGVEIVVVLQRIVIVEVAALIEVSHPFLVVVGVDDGVVLCIVLVRVAVDGELTQALKPSRCQRIVGEETERGGQNVGLPTVFLGLGVAGIAGGDAAAQFIVALGLQQLVDVVFLRVGELVPLEEGAVGHAHGP